MTDIVDPTDPANWTFTESHRFALSRHLDARPVGTIEVDYTTVERFRGRPIDATYRARVVAALIQHHWDEEKQSWRSSGVLRVRLINEATGEPYVTGWKGEMVYRCEENITNHDEIVGALINATVPTTTIQIIETPAA